MDLFMQIVGYMLIYIACDVGRKEESSVKIFTWQWVLQVTLVTIGVIINNNYNS